MDVENSMKRLSEISLRMNEQGIPLEESLKLYGEAVFLIRECKEEISNAELEVKKLESK